MNFQEVYKKLKSLGTDQTVKIYKRHGAPEGHIFGVSIANLKELQKSIVSPEGKKKVNQDIADKLWETGNVDAQYFASLIAEPGKMDKKGIEKWNKEKQSFYMVGDALGRVIYQSEHGMDFMKKWTQSKQEYTRRIGFVILNYMAQKDDQPDSFFTPYVEQCEKELQSSANRAKEGMNNCLIAIGARNEKLRQRVMKAAGKIGPVEIDHGETSCQTFIIEEYLDRIYERKKSRSRNVRIG